MSQSNSAPEKRRVGRPRKRPSPELEGEPREQIIAAAAQLFAARGIAEVSMLEIAECSGLGTSSLYYWFRRKELIVAELLSQVNRLPLAYAHKLEREGDSPDVQLYRLVQFDVRTVCEFPLEITEVHRFGRKNRAAFETYWRERRELTAKLEQLIEKGSAQGAFREVDGYLCALTILAQDESVQNWFTPDGRGRERAKLRSGVQSDARAQRYRAEQIAEFVATQTLAGLIAAPSRLDAIKRRVPARAR